jgi:DNA-binding response OmpR family regulator
MSLPVVLATTGAEALAVARERRPALVVLDVGLPDVSGFEVCRELRDQLGDHLPIILVSGVKTDEHDRVAGLLLGADDYFAKPLDTTLFKARVRRLVGRVAAAGEAASDGRAGSPRASRRCCGCSRAGTTAPRSRVCSSSARGRSGAISSTS